MNKQVKININDKAYYCDMEVLKLIERLQDKVELLEYNRDKAIEYIDTTEFSGNNVLYDGNIIYYNQDVLKCLLNILNSEVEIIEDTPKEDKKIERIDYLDFNEYSDENKPYCLLNKINEIIDKVNGE